MNDRARPPDATPRAAAGALPSPRELDSAQLFAGARELVIRHAGETYTLRQTRLGKLILTK